MREEDKPFLMSIEDVFSIKGRGTVATGRVERGTAKVGDEVEIIGLRKDKVKTTITGIEMFQKTLDSAIAGDNVGVLLRGIERDGIERGQVLAKPNSITPHTKFEANIYVLSKDEGGRHTPFFSGYKPQFYFRTTDVTGSISLPEGVEMCMPGDNVKVDGRADGRHARRHGRRPPLRHPRRRPHRRLGRGHEDPWCDAGRGIRYAEENAGRDCQGPPSLSLAGFGIGLPNSALRIPQSIQVRSSIGRAAVSKTAGWGFDSLRTC